MLYEYKKVSIEHFDCNVLFFGRELTPADYAYSGNNARDYYVLHFILSGKGSFASAGNRMTHLTAGDVFILPRGVPCFYQADHQDPWEYSWIGFSGSSVRDILLQSQLMERHYLKGVASSQFAKEYQTLYQSLHQPLNLSHRLLVQSGIFQTFHRLIQEYPSQKGQSKTSSYEHFNQAVQLMKHNLADGYNVTDVGAALHLSRSYLHTIFKKFAESSPQQYLLNLRMETAKEFLKDTNYSLQNVASLVGYKDQFTFSKAFKRLVGKSPQEFRLEK
ncbi:AraC family transcriptional regulator [Enterococcus sp. HY326]|uniref:AraC family transcriptional regulator n=1 Tax=Enterococcus sp. HY326 TaxID=2971265 RepID=UPI00223FB768|nr:AraC family ligand binding domain-containing protein [Enterococcus sp. HY326]